MLTLKELACKRVLKCGVSISDVPATLTKDLALALDAIIGWFIVSIPSDISDQLNNFCESATSHKNNCLGWDKSFLPIGWVSNNCYVIIQTKEPEKAISKYSKTLTITRYSTGEYPSIDTQILEFDMNLTEWSLAATFCQEVGPPIFNHLNSFFSKEITKEQLTCYPYNNMPYLLRHQNNWRKCMQVHITTDFYSPLYSNSF